MMRRAQAAVTPCRGLANAQCSEKETIKRVRLRLVVHVSNEAVSGTILAAEETDAPERSSYINSLRGATSTVFKMAPLVRSASTLLFAVVLAFGRQALGARPLERLTTEVGIRAGLSGAAALDATTSAVRAALVRLADGAQPAFDGGHLPRGAGERPQVERDDAG
jgi:hypothetical protein